MDLTCETAGDGDLYGLGVRLGLYLQWAAGFLLRNFDGSWKTISTVRTTNNVLCGAVALTTIINTSAGTSLAVDYLIVYYLTIVLFYAESYNLLAKTNADNMGLCYWLVPDVPLLVQNSIFAVMTLFGAWFWLKGVFQTTQTTCIARAALLGSFDLTTQQWRIFAATFAIIVGLIFCLIFLVHLYGLLTNAERINSAPVLYVANAMKVASGSPYFITAILKDFLRPELKNTRAIWGHSPAVSVLILIQFFLINLAGPIIAIVSVERMVRTNHLVTPAISSSSGQMLALLTGITSCCVAAWELSKGKQKGKMLEPLAYYIYHARKPLERNELSAVIEELKEWEELYRCEQEGDPRRMRSTNLGRREARFVTRRGSSSSSNRESNAAREELPPAERPDPQVGMQGIRMKQQESGELSNQQLDNDGTPCPTRRRQHKAPRKPTEGEVKGEMEDPMCNEDLIREPRGD